MTFTSEHSVNPFNKEQDWKPLWAIYGHKAFPSIIACKVKWHPLNPTIWGLGRNRTRFQTLGQDLQEWINANGDTIFFDSQERAIEFINMLVTPSKGAMDR